MSNFNKNGEEKKSSKKRIWKRECEPLRHLVLWGVDSENNPSFLILYGKQDFYEQLEDGNNLSHEVTYTNYIVVKGKNGHLPSFKKVKILEEEDVYMRERGNLEFPIMCHKKGVNYYWSWSINEDYIIDDFKHLEENEYITLPYFLDQTHEEYVEKIISKRSEKENGIINVVSKIFNQKKEIQDSIFEGFTLVKDPNDILNLSDENMKYYDDICGVMSNSNIYMRRKYLNQILNDEPNKDLYDLLLKIGSGELISGLFLELAKRNNDAVIEEAQKLIESDITFEEKNFAEGIKRCARIYVNNFKQEEKQDRIKYIRENLDNMDLHLISIDGKEVKEGTIIEGSKYRKYANQEILSDYKTRWEYEDGRYNKLEEEAKKRYKIGPYTDGIRLKINEVKNAIQEAECYGLSDVIGKIAYYLDAPRVNYYLKGNHKGKTLKYFKRYVRRIMDGYTKNDEEKFITAMKSLLTSYKNHDYMCKFKGNFQFNEFIKYYLYYDYKEKPPVVDWNEWEIRHDYMSNDQLAKLQGRYEMSKDIWDNYLDVVAEIAVESEVYDIVKACYFIFKESKNTDKFIQNMTYSELIKLTEVKHELLSEIFMELLSNKLKTSNGFDADLMIELMNIDNKNIHKMTEEYFKGNNGRFSPNNIIEIMLLSTINNWIDIFENSLISLDDFEYFEFVKNIIDSADKFINKNIEISKEVKEILSLSLSKAKNMDSLFINEIITKLSKINKLIDWIEAFIEEVVFSVSYEKLQDVLKSIEINKAEILISARSSQIISLLTSIKNRKLITDAEFISILETGTSKSIKMLFRVLDENIEELKNRHSTILIMLESNVVNLNIKGENIFDSLDDERQKKLHAIIIDSPIKKVYAFGLKRLDEIYKDIIPKQFVVQMLEHTETEVKDYISDKVHNILKDLDERNKDIFIYYVKTLLLLPNKVSKGKDFVYKCMVQFALKFNDKKQEIEDILMDIGCSNIIVDSERALVTLAAIRKETVLIEG